MIKLGYIADFFYKQIYPNRCLFCRTLIDEDKVLCASCHKKLPVHGVCQGTRGGYRCSAAFIYHGKPKHAVLRFKFKGKTSFAEKFAQLLATDVKRSYEDMIFDYITYVPMHKKAKKKRGYNQSELLAKELSKILGIPCVETLTKIKHTKPQHKLKSKERLKNLKGVFKITDKNLIKDKSILIIDDIITTGTTLGECAKTLQKANPSLICCETILTTARLY